MVSRRLLGVVLAVVATCIPTTVALAAQAQHVLIISIDGLHQADLDDPALQADIPNILALAQSGVEYTHASCGGPSDSFPGSAAYLTGAGPKTTGVYFDDTYSRALRSPQAASPTALGTPVGFTGAIDKDPERLDGGGDSGMGSIDVDNLPLAQKDGKWVPVYPHDYLKVNTIFEVVHEAGLRTAVIDKHPCYDLANGPSGKGVDDLYGPESDAKLGLVDGQLVDYRTLKPDQKIKLVKLTKNMAISNAYDDLRMAALLNLIAGKDARGAASPGVPALFSFNFIALNTAQKRPEGGIARNADGTEGAVSSDMHDALHHVDDNIGKIVQALKQSKIYDSTLVIVTAKHAQGCRLGFCTTIGPDTFTAPLETHGVQVAQATQDDVGLYWLTHPEKTPQAMSILTALAAVPGNGVDEILSGPALVAAGFGDPAVDDRTPDIIIKLKPGYVIHDKDKRAEHGGFSEDDTHVGLILSGAVPASVRGTRQGATVSTKQIAVAVLDALGLDSQKLQGAQAEKTPALPGLK